jgi:protein-S-isoprenylcysteine O-methyltransferase Ste14
MMDRIRMGGSSMTPSLSKTFVVTRGLIYSSAFVFLWTWVAVSVRRFDSGHPLAVPVWLRMMGWPLALAGALLAALCIGTFLTKGRGTPAPFDPPREFVASGPYRYVRNPMYIGAAGVILGAGLILSSVSIVLLAFAFLAIMHLFVVVHEEPALTERFGDSYLRYKSSVHRWLIGRPSFS